MQKPIKKHGFFLRTLGKSSLLFSSLLLSFLILLGCVYFYLAMQLPDVKQLRDVRLQVPLKVYTSDGKLIGIFGEKKRIPITLKQVPKQLIQAILDTEDQRFFEHSGVDFIGLLRAAKAVFSSGKRSQGASTITMQVARNFFLNSNKTYTRKITEIMLALKIDQELTKEEILELYINKIYLGQRAYGVAAAAQVYFGKDIARLTLPELALLAGLPQAPSRDNPVVNPGAALERRNHVLERMYDNKHIDYVTYQAAIAAPLTSHYHEYVTEVQAPHLAEMVRSSMVQQFGNDVYDRGYDVYTTIDSHLQEIATLALRTGVLAYDQRHGYRGSERHFTREILQDADILRLELSSMPVINGLLPAVVMDIDDRSLVAFLDDGRKIHMPIVNSFSLHAVRSLKVGDVIRVQKKATARWEIAQIPNVEAALVALNPQNGAILALIGGFSYEKSNFNRAVQADRQTGSAFKPFIYSAALEKGFTLASVINDAPLVFNDPAANMLWRPQNDNLRFTGPTRLRVGLTRSRNMVSIRLLQAIGIPYALNYLQRFGFERQNLPYGLSLALGTANSSPTQLASAYATFANGGYRITPYFISTIKTQDDKVIFQANPNIVPSAFAQSSNFAERVISTQNAYLMTDALKDVIRYGTGSNARKLHRNDLAGKTGTTNNKKDAWFCGFNGDLVTAVWLGFDQPQPLYEYAAEASLPIWIDFMGQALKGRSENTLPEPENVTNVRIDPKSGLIARAGQKNAIFELFTDDTVPKQIAPQGNDGENSMMSKPYKSGQSSLASDSTGGNTASEEAFQPLF